MVSKNQNINLIKKYLEELKSVLQTKYNKSLEFAPDAVKKYVTKIEVIYME